jgi:hypothetical protein
MAPDLKQFLNADSTKLDLADDNVSTKESEGVRAVSNASAIVQLQQAGYNLNEKQQSMMAQPHKRSVVLRVGNPNLEIKQRQQYIDGLLIQSRCVQCESSVEKPEN